jgi:hypothetical protein
VVVPTQRESVGASVEKTLDILEFRPGVELIFVDKSFSNSRAERLNHGLSLANGSMILFYHPRSKLDLAFILGSPQN